MIEYARVLLIGPPTTGKVTLPPLSPWPPSGRVISPSIAAFDLALDMAEAEATGTRKELIDNLCKVDLLVLEGEEVAHTASPTIRLWGPERGTCWTKRQPDSSSQPRTSTTL